MNTKLKILLLMLIFGFMPLPAEGQTASHEYTGVITLVWGPASEHISVGEEVSVMYAVDTLASDVDPGPDVGRYPDGLLELTVEAFQSGVFTHFGSGTVTVFNNTENPDDQVSMRTFVAIEDGDLGGLPILGVEIGFIGPTSMLSDESVPSDFLTAYQYSVFLLTDEGWSGFQYQLEGGITTSPSSFDLSPTRVGVASVAQAVVYRNSGSQVISLFGASADAPFQLGGDCLLASVLYPNDSCQLSVQLVPDVGAPLGDIQGTARLESSVGTVALPIRGFVYASALLPGLQNLEASVAALGFVPPQSEAMYSLLQKVRVALTDGRPQNDRKACPHLRRFARIVENEAVGGWVTDWSAVAMLTQTQALWRSISCRGRF